MSNPADTFRQEATDILESLEENLLELEGDPENRAMVDTVFRALHTIKGSGEMFGFSELAKFVHHLENAFELVRSGDARVSQELIDISLASQDHISALLDAGQDETMISELINSQVHSDLLNRIAKHSSVSASTAAESAEADGDSNAGMVEYRILFKPEPSALRNGMRPDLISSELELLGECTSKVLTDMVPPLQELDAGACYLSWELMLKSDAGRDRIDEIFLFFDDGDIQIEETSLEVEVPEEPIEKVEAPAHKASEKRAESAGKVESVRVQAYRLDELMDQLGELVIAQARLNRIAERMNDQSLGVDVVACFFAPFTQPAADMLRKVRRKAGCDFT